MDLRDSVIVVTGGGSGIGAALCERFAGEDPRSVTILDQGGDAAERVAARLATNHPSVAFEGEAVDVSSETDLRNAIRGVCDKHGTVDLFVGNAGIGTGIGLGEDGGLWQRTFDVNVMAHVYASRELIPRWLERGHGSMLITASAAGLLTNLGDAPYSVTKHGAVAFAEWLSITYGDRGIHIACLCPQGVRTPLLFPEMSPDFDPTDVSPDQMLALQVVRSQRILEPSDVADSVMDALEDGRFLILPHEEVATYEQARANDREHWLRSMRRIQSQLDALG